MPCRIITIARSASATGEETGRAVAEQLGFRYVDDEIIARAAEKAGITAQTIEAQERSHSLAAQILSAMSDLVASTADENLPTPDRWDDPSSAYRRLILDVIRETAAEGSAVIVAHGASIHLAGTAGLLRVFVTASPDTRARRLAAATGLDEARARRQIEHSDRERRAYLDRFYRVRQELPTHYDLVINTDILEPVLAVQAILAVAAVMA
jgi:cytidylate kinase